MHKSLLRILQYDQYYETNKKISNLVISKSVISKLTPHSDNGKEIQTKFKILSFF